MHLIIEATFHQDKVPQVSIPFNIVVGNKIYLCIGRENDQGDFPQTEKFKWKFVQIKAEFLDIKIDTIAIHDLLREAE